MTISMPRGTYDVLPDEIHRWHYVERVARDVARRYHFSEVRTPIFEHTELFQRGVGETTDIVEKEMYTFTDRKGRSLTLRPEGTAAVVRSFIEHKVYAQPQPTKWYYLGPMFRYERPQSGRFRQFVQFGAEVLGADDPSVDAEIIAMVDDLLQELGIRQYRLELNSLGCPQCRPRHREALLAHLRPLREALCADCQSRLERNPLRILDCKNERCRELTADTPSILEHLCSACADHFAGVRKFLDELGISYIVNPRMVRGLDYYTQTAFEFIAESVGAVGTIAAGGRYNGLVASLGGQDVPGIGFATGLERLLAVMAAEGVEPPAPPALDCFVVAVGEESRTAAVSLLHRLRKAGLAADLDHLNRKVKAQLKAADRLQAKYVLILGEDELSRGTVQLRRMADGVQEEIPLEAAVERVSMQSMGDAVEQTLLSMMTGKAGPGADH
ncbi:MAG: histidine--tRNA ligase [Bacillota bacterium]|nr:histidine--tRNA ligase [Bacillota bacterium]